MVRRGRGRVMRRYFLELGLIAYTIADREPGNWAGAVSLSSIYGIASTTGGEWDLEARFSRGVGLEPMDRTSMGRGSIFKS